jgi:NADPH2:quinone reductase
MRVPGSMRAIVIDKFHEPGMVRDVPEPELEDRSILVRVAYSGVNPIDWKVRAGETGERNFPLVLGQDFAGVVVRTGPGVTRLRAGDRVFGCARDYGSYADETCVPDGQRDSPVAAIPDAIDDRVAAALPTPGLTALASLDALGIERGTQLLIVGAAGSVGSTAVQIALKRGAEVTAFVEKGQGDRVRGFGDVRVVESSGDMLADIRAVHPEPFAAVLDLVDDRVALERNEPLYAKGGRFVTTIHAADEEWFGGRGVVATNIVMIQTNASSPEGLAALAAMVSAGDLRVSVGGERPLAEAPAVLDGLESGKLSGKFVLRAN